MEVSPYVEPYNNSQSAKVIGKAAILQAQAIGLMQECLRADNESEAYQFASIAGMAVGMSLVQAERRKPESIVRETIDAVPSVPEHTACQTTEPFRLQEYTERQQTMLRTFTDNPGTYFYPRQVTQWLLETGISKSAASQAFAVLIRKARADPQFAGRITHIGEKTSRQYAYTPPEPAGSLAPEDPKTPRLDARPTAPLVLDSYTERERHLLEKLIEARGAYRSPRVIVGGLVASGLKPTAADNAFRRLVNKMRTDPQFAGNILQAGQRKYTTYALSGNYCMPQITQPTETTRLPEGISMGKTVSEKIFSSEASVTALAATQLSVRTKDRYRQIYLRDTPLNIASHAADLVQAVAGHPDGVSFGILRSTLRAQLPYDISPQDLMDLLDTVRGVFTQAGFTEWQDTVVAQTDGNRARVLRLKPQPGTLPQA